MIRDKEYDMIRTKEVTRAQTEFIPKLYAWLVAGYRNYDTFDGMDIDVAYYKALIEKISIIGEYTQDEADELTQLTHIYKKEQKN
jgi:hypothetical protein